MKLTMWAAAVTLALVASGESNAESAQEILEAAWDAQVSRWEGLDSYLVEQSVMGRTSKQYFLRAVVADAAGNERTMFLRAPDAGLEPGCINPSSLTDVASDKGENSAEYLSRFMNNAELVGEETIDGNAAWQLRANDLDESQAVGGQDVTMNSMSMWISKSEYLPLKMRMEGVATVQGQSRPVVIETTHSDFRTVPGSQLREPFRRVINASGMLGGADTEQIAQARAQMAELEKQMASMPPSQREMMESMMGPQLEMLRRLGETGGIETEVLVQSITPNPEAFGERLVACGARD